MMKKSSSAWGSTGGRFGNDYVVRYRIHRMKRKLKDELDSRSDKIQHYECPNCKKRYSAMDALQLVCCSTDEYFHCENCDGELIAAESDVKIASSEETGDGNGDVGNARKRRRREELKDMLRRIDQQLEPLMVLIQRVKGLHAPEFRSLHAHVDDPGAADSYVGEIEVEVALSSGSGAEEGGADHQSGIDGSGLKSLPPWMVREGMNLTEEQRGETSSSRTSSKVGERSEGDDDRKQEPNGDEKSVLQYEYAKAYYETIMKIQEKEDVKRMQQEGHTFCSESLPKRQLGTKSKREDGGVDQDEGVEWEEQQPAGNTAEMYKFVDSNAEVPECAGEGEDDIDWDEG